MKLKNKMLSMLILPLGILLNQPIEPDNSIQTPVIQQPLSKIQVIEKYSSEYNVDPKLVEKVMLCESSGNPNAINNHEPNNVPSVGIMQFQRKTFDYMSKEMGEQLDFYSYHDQIKLATWAISNGMGRHWTCYRKVTGK